MSKKNKPNICLLMIVKNEGHVIKETLENLKQYIDYWVICDTGSTDGTQEIIQEYFKEINIPGELVCHEWENFGHNRTLAFKEAFNKSKYVLVFDADDIIVGNFEIPKNLSADAYYFKFGRGFTYVRLQLFKNSLNWCYKGILHEFPKCLSKKDNNLITKTIEGDYYVDSRRLGSRNLDPLKYENDAKKLLHAIENNIDPDLKSRYLFYLAQSYRDAKQYENSIKYYIERVNAGGWVEEIYYSCWQIGNLMQLTKKYDNQEIINWYFKAHRYIPTRGETLYAIGLIYFIENQYSKAKTYFENVSKMQIPSNSLFVDEIIYKYYTIYYAAICCNKQSLFNQSNIYLMKLKDTIDLNDGEQRDINILEIYNNKQTIIEKQKNFEGYTFYLNKDSYSNDILYVENKTLDEMYKIANDIPYCLGFNTLGYFKSIIFDPDSFIELPNTNNFINNGIYIKN
jgi:tetratricopeptide (TPR) repeat protein